MKYFANFLFLFVVIHATTYARYLLVELNNEEGEPNSAFLAEATCDAKKHSSWTTIVDTCPGYKLLLKSSTIFTAYTRCCEAVKADPECGNNWFLGPLTGACFCEKRGYDCIRSGSVYTEYRFGEEESQQLIQPQTNDLIASPELGFPGDDKICCRAMTAECLACTAGISISDYCESHPATLGCEDAKSQYRRPPYMVGCDNTCHYDPFCNCEHKEFPFKTCHKAMCGRSWWCACA